MKTLHSLLTMSLLASPLVGCDALLDKDDELRTSEDDLDVDPNEDEDDREDPEDEDDREVDDERPDPQAVHAFAIRHGDLPEIDLGGADDGGSGGDPGSEIDPDSLLVIITNGAATCKEPFAADECGTRWSVSFTLSPEQQKPGTYSLWDDLNGGFSVTGEPYPEGDCSWGGGSLEGMLDIFEVDGNVVRGEIYDAQAFDFDANMAFDAASCE